MSMRCHRSSAAISRRDALCGSLKGTPHAPRDDLSYSFSDIVLPVDRRYGRPSRRGIAGGLRDPGMPFVRDTRPVSVWPPRALDLPSETLEHDE
jgi:hypothetical protein